MSDTSSAKDPLPIRSLEFLGGMAKAGGWRPDDAMPEIAFCGRSNVGKSSLLNRLVRRRSLARVSNTPGRTREINFFRVNGQFLLADLPGYGFARVSKAVRAQWQPLIESYFANAATLRGVVHLVDARHDPTPDDVQMAEWLAALGVPVLIVATKADKLRAQAIPERVASIAQVLGVDQRAIVPVSSTTGAGRDEMARALVALVDTPAARRNARGSNP